MTVKLDEVTADALYYVGVAFANNSTADPVWEIQKITISSGDVDVENPIGVASNKAIWDNRTTYSYG